MHWNVHCVCTGICTGTGTGIPVRLLDLGRQSAQGAKNARRVRGASRFSLSPSPCSLPPHGLGAGLRRPEPELGRS